MTRTITVRLTEKERRQLQKHGRISEVTREALRLYLNSEKSRQLISRLRELQKTTKLQTTIKDDLQQIRADRQR
jgi:uncharacterized protein YlbG (UPF0298 family)